MEASQRGCDLPAHCREPGHFGQCDSISEGLLQPEPKAFLQGEKRTPGKESQRCSPDRATLAKVCLLSRDGVWHYQLPSQFLTHREKAFSSRAESAILSHQVGAGGDSLAKHTPDKWGMEPLKATCSQI